MALMERACNQLLLTCPAFPQLEERGTEREKLGKEEPAADDMARDRDESKEPAFPWFGHKGTCRCELSEGTN